jgi:GH25 family lysozyme M1 (1,4-beta-N-acetylmuramidase)
MAAISRGIDVSSYQGRQDWAALARGGLTFAQVKASEGEHTRDDHYRMHMDGVLSVPSLLPQAYHYAWPNQDARAEADNYIGAVQHDADAHPAFVHWLDLERRKDGDNYRGASDAQIRAYAEAWITRVRAAFPHQRVGCYTSGEDIRRGHYPRNSDGLWYPAYPAGAMSYTQAQGRARPAPHGVRCLFWQFTSTPVDRSICYMTPAALRAWAGVPAPEVPDMTPDQDARLKRVEAALAALPGALSLAPWTYRNATADKASKAAGHRIPDAYGYQTGTYEGVQQLTAQVAALSATVAALAQDGGITAEQVQAAAQAGAQAALAELGAALTDAAPEPAEPAQS